MLSVVDRSVRLREKRVAPFADESGRFDAELAAGVLQHLHDDDWFHTTRGFAEISGALTRLFRSHLPDDDSPRVAFLGHIVTELQLDGALILRYPRSLDRYYELLRAIDTEQVQECVNRMATRPTERLSLIMRRFREEEFMRCYTAPDRLLHRLNQVMLRVRLEALPASFESALAASWSLVSDRVEALLPRDRFFFPPADRSA